MSRKTLLCLSTAFAAALLTLSPLASAADAAPHAAAATPGYAAIVVPPIVYKQRTLANGMTVIYSRDTSTPNVAVQMWYGVGAKDDPAGRSGFAHLFEHLMFKSTQDMPSDSLSHMTGDVGGGFNAATDYDFTAYHEYAPAAHLQRLLWAEAERMSKLVVDDANFQSERHVVEEEVRQDFFADPYGRLYLRDVPKYSYTAHPYKRPALGTIEDLDAATLDDVLTFHATYYRPDNVALIVVGNFDEKKLNAWVDQYMGAIKTPATPIPRVTVVEPPRTGPLSVITYGPNVPLPEVAITWLGPKASDKDAAAVQVLTAILGNGKASRLYHDMIYTQQIANVVYAYENPTAQPGYILLMAIMADGKTPDQGQAALMAEATDLRIHPVSDAELKEAKTGLIADLVRNREDIDTRGWTLGYALRLEGDAGKANSAAAELNGVTVADVQAAAQKYLDPNLANTIRYLNESERPKGETEAPAIVPPVSSVKFTGQTYSLLPEKERQPPPPLGATVNPVLPTPAQMTLANGLRVVVARSSGLPLVAARLIARSGATSDPVDRPGVANLMADVITEGTATHSASDIARKTEALGTEIDAAPDWESSSLSLNVVKNNAAPALALLADIAEHPLFAPAEVDRARSQELDNLKVNAQDPSALAKSVLNTFVYAGTPMGHSQMGTVASLAKITRDDLVTLHDGAWRPDNAVLVLTGDITPAEGFALAKSAFGDWKAPKGPAMTAPAVSPPAAAPPRNIIIDIPGAGQTDVIASKIAIARNDPDYYTGIVASAVLGSGFTSWLNEEIRIKRGLAYGAYSSLTPHLTTGAFTAAAQTKNESAAEVAGLLRTQIARLSTEPVGAGELQARKSYLIGNYGFGLAEADRLASVLGTLAFYNIDPGEINRITAKISAVTPEQIQAFAKAKLNPSQLGFIVVGDKSKMGEAITTALPNATIIPVTAFDSDSADLKSSPAKP